MKFKDQHNIFLFIASFLIFAKSAPAKPWPSNAPNQKPTVCTITINSSDEREVFQSYLEDDFNFVELTEFGAQNEGTLDSTSYGYFTSNKNDWLAEACKQGVECDVLVISGHFGGSFFGSSNKHLALEELQRRSCQKACDGILKKPKEVFLFGCNTMAGKSPDHRTPEEYARVLMEDGFSRRLAEEVSAFRYSPIGQQTKQRMRQVFPHSRIYGFHSQAPLGKRLTPRLKSYFESISDYKFHLKRFPTEEENRSWSSAMKGQWIRSMNGDGELENPVCVLEENEPIYKKLYWIDDVLSDEQRTLSYLPVIDVYLRELQERFGGWDALPDEEMSLLERIQFNYEAKERVDELLEKAIGGIVSAQVKILNFGQRVGWYNKRAYAKKLKNLIGEIFKENLDREQADLICSLGVELDLVLEDLPEEAWNSHTISAIGCVRPQDVRISLSLTEALKDTDQFVRQQVAWALAEIMPDNP